MANHFYTVAKKTDSSIKIKFNLEKTFPFNFIPQTDEIQYLNPDVKAAFFGKAHVILMYICMYLCSPIFLKKIKRGNSLFIPSVAWVHSWNI